jgi:hypothetical protein
MNEWLNFGFVTHHQHSRAHQIARFRQMVLLGVTANCWLLPTQNNLICARIYLMFLLGTGFTDLEQRSATRSKSDQNKQCKTRLPCSTVGTRQWFFAQLAVLHRHLVLKA